VVRLQTLVELEKERSVHRENVEASFSMKILEATAEEERERADERERVEMRVEGWMAEVMESRRLLHVSRERSLSLSLSLSLSRSLAL